VLTINEAPHHPHNLARRTFVEVDGVLQQAPAPRFSRTVAAQPESPSLPGDHTHAVLGGLGFDAASVTELTDAGVVRQSAALTTE
jgi:alpha-methylacyl-CoA racemase